MYVIIKVCRKFVYDTYKTMKAIRTRMFVTHRPTLTIRHTFDLSTSCRPVASLPALGPWAHPRRTGLFARKYLPGFPYS